MEDYPALLIEKLKSAAAFKVSASGLAMHDLVTPLRIHEIYGFVVIRLPGSLNAFFNRNLFIE